MDSHSVLSVGGVVPEKGSTSLGWRWPDGCSTAPNAHPKQIYAWICIDSYGFAWIRIGSALDLHWSCTEAKGPTGHRGNMQAPGTPEASQPPPGAAERTYLRGKWPQRICGTGILRKLPSPLRIEREVELILPTKLEARLGQGVVTILGRRMSLG